MAGVFSREGARFLYRTYEGTISRKAWWAGVIPLALAAGVLTLLWLALAPWAGRGLDERAFIDPRTLAAYVYLAIYGFALIFIAVAYAFLSAKRMRARGRAPGLATLLPLAIFLAASAHFMHKLTPDAFPLGLALAMDAVLAAVALWHIADLGLSSDPA